MADKKIVDLASIVTLSDTDVKEVSDSTGSTPSKKETRLQTKQNTTAYVNANAQLSSSAQVTGLDETLSNLQTQIDDISLQDGYDNGNGSINLADNKPLRLNSTQAGFILPSMTTAQFSSIGILNNGEMAWDNNLDRVTVNANTTGDPRIETVAYLSDIQALETDAIYGEMFFQGNSNATSISVTGTPVIVNATYSSGSLQGFTHSAGTLTYTASATRPVLVTVSDTVTYDGSSNNTSIYIALNGSVITKSKQTDFVGGITPATQSNPVQCVIPSLATNDQIQVWITNEDSTDDPIVQDLNCVVSSIGGTSSGAAITVEGEDYLDFSDDVLTANPIDLSGSNVENILTGTNGGTSNGFFAVSGPATSLKTFTFPNSSATVLTTNSAVTEVQGGTNQTTYTQGDLLYASSANTLSKLAKNTSATRYLSNTGTSNNPAWSQINLSNGVTGTLPYNQQADQSYSFNTMTINTQINSTGATVVKSFESRNGQCVTGHALVRFTATSALPTISLNTTYTTLNSSNQASGTGTVVRTSPSGNANQGDVVFCDSNAGIQLQYNMIIASGVTLGQFDLNISFSYQIQ